MVLDWLITILGALVGLAFTIKVAGQPKAGRMTRRTETWPASNNQSAPPLPAPTPMPMPDSFGFDDSVPGILRDAANEALLRRGRPRQVPLRQGRAENLITMVNGKNLIDNWRKAVTGLVRLAESNLQAAESQATMNNYKAAAELAARSIENASRALLHCYGEKPDQDSGQEEPLKLLARRLQGDEKAQFEKAIGEAVQLYRDKIVQADLSEKCNQTPLLRKEKTQQMLETATRIVAQFRRIIDEHFTTEIPDLGERCPKCGASTIVLWAFGPEGSNCQCSRCRHRWIQPT